MNIIRYIFVIILSIIIGFFAFRFYDNFSEFMEIEENFGVKSTFFFRTQYENSDYRDYEEVIKKITKSNSKIKPTINIDHIKTHYYGSHPTINPNGIIPTGPDIY